MVLPILQSDNALLREKAEPVPESLFGTPELRKMVADMEETLDREEDGVALAATQVGIPYRLFIVRYDRLLPPLEDGEPARKADLGVFANPQFVRLSQKSFVTDEGCLSVRDIYGKTRRRERASVRAQDVDGKMFERGGGKVLAQAFQHELEHLDGVLFIDHAKDLIEVKHARHE